MDVKKKKKKKEKEKKLSCFVDKILQPMAQQQNIQGINGWNKINVVCPAYDTFYDDTPTVPKRLLGKALRLIFQENSFQFNKRNYLQTHGTAWAIRCP